MRVDDKKDWFKMKISNKTHSMVVLSELFSLLVEDIDLWCFVVAQLV